MLHSSAAVWQLSFVTGPEQVDAIHDWLMEHQALAVTLQDAADEALFAVELNEAPLWQCTQVSALFSDEQHAEKAQHDLQQQFSIQQTSLENLPAQDWQRACMDQFKPTCFADKLWICPSWSEPVANDAVRVRLDPGLAFGTGTHPTTAMCLTWLANNIVGGETVIDYGCGSGILAIAASKLGAKQVVGVDTDQQALEATADNANRNHLTVTGFRPDNLPAMSADILIANILAKPLCELANHFSTLLRSGGKLVLSGILLKQIDDVVMAYQSWCQFSAPVVQDEWVCLSAVVR